MRFWIVVALLISPGLAHAQTREGAFAVESFTPAVGPQSFLTVEGTRVGTPMSYSAALVLDYADDSFVVYPMTCPADPFAPVGECPGPAQRAVHPIRVVDSLVTANLLATFVPLRNLQVGVDLPFAYIRGQSIDPESPQSTGPLRAGGLADPVLLGKWRFIGGGEGVGLAGSLALSIPFAEWTAQGPNDSHLGNSSPTVTPRVLVDFRRNNLELGANAGALLRSTAELHGTEVGSRITYGLAAAYQFDLRFRAIGELSGGLGLTVAEAPFEADLAGQVRFEDLLFTLGAGAGLVRAVGVPDVRVIAGVLYSPVRGDLDADGVDDRIDRCPAVPEDADGFVDEDGCPEPDNDEDGFPDSSDRCPFDPEDQDNYQDDDGCVDPDNDGDGVPDGYDSCPSAAEDRDGDRDDDGCPDNDTDGDNIPDDADRCPSDMEDTDGFQDEDGCPDADNDADGIPDEQDQCEDQLEDRDGISDDDGCPEEDGDGDGVIDTRDKCPNDPGRIAWQGCATYPALRDALRNP